MTDELETLDAGHESFAPLVADARRLIPRASDPGEPAGAPTPTGGDKAPGLGIEPDNFPAPRPNQPTFDLRIAGRGSRVLVWRWGSSGPWMDLATVDTTHASDGFVEQVLDLLNRDPVEVEILRGLVDKLARHLWDERPQTDDGRAWWSSFATSKRGEHDAFMAALSIDMRKKIRSTFPRI